MSRVITALVALPILIVSIWLPKLALLFDILGATAILLALYEFYILARRQEANPNVTLGLLAAAALLLAFHFKAFLFLPVIIAALVIMALALTMLGGAPFDKMLASVGATTLGVCYVALLGGYLIAVREMPLAAQILSFFFLVLMGSDTAAYYTGRAFGRRKLAPSVSPGKTLEGAIGGMAASLAFAALAHFWFFSELKLDAALLLAAVMNVLGVIGDLTESALKRGAGAKDAANILPGHGGLLDRLDSLLFNAPLIYYFALLYFKTGV
jgi:phosphatidate cytidylyltransferase